MTDDNPILGQRRTKLKKTERRQKGQGNSLFCSNHFQVNVFRCKLSENKH